MFVNSLGQTLRLTRTNSMWVDRMIETTDALRLSIGRELGLDPPEAVDCGGDGEPAP